MGEPECNGIMERWIRTLKEECLYLHAFATLEEARQVIRGVHRALQLRVAARAARRSDSSRAPSSADPRGGLIKPQTCLRNRDRYTSSFQSAALPTELPGRMGLGSKIIEGRRGRAKR
ncbi:MAG: integrase core domain-containing protein [Tepidiformaceae bacterium]